MCQEHEMRRGIVTKYFMDWLPAETKYSKEIRLSRK